MWATDKEIIGKQLQFMVRQVIGHENNLMKPNK